MREPKTTSHWLAAGVAALMCTHANAQSLIVTLTPSDYNGYNVSCGGGQDGAISLSVSGGSAPYSYQWSTGATTQDVSGLSAGYYIARVTDSQDVGGWAEITLTEPEVMRLEMLPFEYPSGYNISCFSCYNGSIDLVISGGVAPYGYSWSHGATVQDPTGLGSGNYSVYVTDANECEAKQGEVYLREPERNDWTMSGNAGTNPPTQYIGTSDNKDVVLKTNGVERLRLLGTGEVKAASLAFTSGYRLLVADSTGALKWLTGGGGTPVPDGCPAQDRLPWTLCGNNIALDQYLGTNNSMPLVLKTAAQQRMIIEVDGRVGIGSTAPQQQLDVAHEDDRGGISLINKQGGANAHSEIRFMKNGTQRWGLGCDFEADGGQDFFIWDHLASLKRLVISADGKVGIGVDPPDPSSSIYQLYVHQGIMTRDVKVTINTFNDYVFAPEYPLMPLSELRDHLNKYRHLPGIPSEAEIRSNEGVELGDFQMRMLKVAEEQALYILQLEERMHGLEQQLALLADRVGEMTGKRK